MIVLMRNTQAQIDPLFLPTSKEQKKAVANQPDSVWGHQARTEKSLRILAIGGSNTARLDGYVKMLDVFVRQTFPLSSCVLNRGVSGMGADYFVGEDVFNR